jgi:hypothetical protein
MRIKFKLFVALVVGLGVGLLTAPTSVQAAINYLDATKTVYGSGFGQLWRGVAGGRGRSRKAARRPLRHEHERRVLVDRVLSVQYSSVEGYRDQGAWKRHEFIRLAVQHSFLLPAGLRGVHESAPRRGHCGHPQLGTS